MRSLILTLFIVLGASFGSSAQIVETCADSQMPANVFAGAPNPSFMTTITFDPTWTTNAEGYTPSSLGAGFTTSYFSFTVDVMQFYTINIQGAAGSAAIGNDISVSLDSDCINLMTSAELFAGAVPANLSPEDVGCVSLNPGTTYTIALAMDPLEIGDVTITVTDAIGASNVTCAGAPAMVLGSNIGNNSCSSGLVWYSYTVMNGGSVSLTPSMSATGNDISTPVITQTSIDNCVSFTGDVSWTCLPPGTVISFEAGDDTAPIEQGDFNIDIVDDATGLPNELCTDVTPVAAPSCMTTTLTDASNNTTEDACPELLDFGSCGVFNTEGTVWFAFTTDALAQTVDIELTTGTISAATFALIDGTTGCPSGTATLGGCQTTGMLLDQAITANTTYYVVVGTNMSGTDGTFTLTVTPENPPANDVCATGAIDISATAALGVDGTTACATNDLNDFCVAASEDHVVYYTYTVDAGILGNRDVTFTFTINTNTSGTAATGLFFGLFEDCAGTAYMNTPNLGDDPCDALTGTVTYECVEPGTVLTIAVGSADLTEGDFNIMIVEDDTNVAMNDACANPMALMPGVSCVDINESTDNTNGCPEITDLGSSCTFSSDLVVWYELTLPAGATGIDFTNLSAGAQLGLFQNDCPTLTIVDDCFTGDTEFTGLIDGGIYLLAVSQTLVAEGVVTFTWSPQAIPTNDDCDLGTNPDIILETNGTTGCADFEFATCGIVDATNDHQVFYTYTNTSGTTVDLEITIEADAANGNAATQVSITALADDCAAFAGFYPAPLSDSEWCDILGTGMQTLPCIEDGETVLLLFSSAEGDEGDFTIMASEGGMQPVDNNDECVDALDVTPLNTCEWETVTADNNNACPEDFTPPAGCNFDVDPTVWYSFTVPAAAGNYTLEIQNITDGASYLTIYDGGIDCDNPGGTALSADCDSGAGPHDTYDALTPGATYLIAFGNPTPGMYSFEIKLNLLPDNDECADAIVLTGGAATMGTTSCATEEIIPFDSGVCDAGNTDETNTVWYEVTVTAAEKGFNLTVTGTGTALMGNINAVLFETTAAACVADGTTFVDEDCLTSGVLSQQFECVSEGTYLIRISTSDANSGEFDILFEPLPLAQPNDFCDAPDMSLNPGLECTWMETTANSVGACPEDVFLDPTMCGLSVGAVVWYEITAPANATFLDLRLTSGNGANPMMAVFPGNPVDCDNQTFVAGSMCYDGTFTDLIANGNTLIPVTGGDTYLIAIGVTDPAGSTIDFGIKWITPPVNDECVDAITLVGNTATDGTTLCATQPVGGEYNSGVCTDADEMNTVWYTYEVPDTDKGFNVTVNAIGAAPFMGDLNLVVFEPDPIGSCDASAGTMIDEICTASGTINEDFECVGPGTYVIRISTSTDNEGDFQITIEPLAIEQPNDLCDSPDLAAFASQLECEWMTVDASTVGACPESFDFASNCGFDDFPVTWYEVTAPANAEFLDLQINSGGVNPFLAVFESSTDCDNLTAVAGSACYTGTFGDLDEIGQAQVDITPGSTYLIGVGTDNTSGNIIDFGIKWITPPVNDECADAIELTPNMAGGDPGTFTTGPIEGTTQCATEPLTGSACDDDKTNTVWYTYTVEADVKEITIDITNWVNTVIPEGMPEFSVAVLDGCPPATFLNQVDGSTADYCGGEGVDLITLSCLDEGDVITILVSSSADNEGTFDITLNTAEPNCTYTNDECLNAEPLTPMPLDTDEDCIIAAGCNDLACSDFNFAACAGTDQLNAVFYTFTTDADADEAFVNIEITNGEAGELDAPGAVLFNGDCVTPLSIGACGSGAGGEYNSGPLGGPGFIMANTTYTVMVFNSDADQNGGTFDLCVTVSSGCVNDEPCDAFTLEPGIPVNNPATSENCTPDISITGCPPGFDEATLWYQVEVPEGFSYFEITLINAPAPDGVGEGLGEVSIAVGPLDDCNNIIPGDAIYTDCAGFTTEGGVHPIPCAVEYGTYYIQIGSEDELDAGDFEITFTPLDDSDPINDLCSQATELVVSDYCEFFPFDGDLKDACPEINDNGACLFSENSAVWYKITIPDGSPVVSDMDILIEGLGSPILGVYEFDCSQVSEPSMGIISTPNLGNGLTAGCVEMDLAEGIVITPGNEYYILVSSSTNEQLPFTINIKLNAPPINDDPCDTSINPPLDLTGGGSHNGTTCCARGPKDSNPDGSAADFENVLCSAATEDASVWYQYTPSEADDGYNIILEPGDVEGPTSLEVYTGPPGAGCTGNLAALIASCNSNTADIKIGNCFEPGDIIYVKVTTDDPDENCGTFILSINPAVCGPMSDDCIDLADETPIMPITNPEFSIDYVCLTGCLDYACPEDDALGGCPDFVQMPTVWFQVTADDIAAQMFTTVEPNGNWSPIWSVFSGPDCDNLSVVNFGGSPPCSNGDNTPELHQTSVFDDEENYWIMVTIDPASLPASGLDDGSFELCVATTINAIICLGELEGGACDDESLVMEITDREIEDQPLEGPFCQGEEITINISFFYDASESGADWMIGFVPIFGPGWDLEGFDYAGNAPTGNGMTAVWYEEGGDCAPIIQEPNPILCTFTDDDGNLQLCNQLCSPCAECDQQGMLEGDPLPSGYFWVTNGGNAGCDNDCSPGEGWGIGSTMAQIDWTFTLPVKEFDSFDDCFENNDLSISFQTFSDGVGGCWEDPVGECLLDRAMFSPPWMIECEAPPAVEGPDQELCHDGITDILVQTVDGSTVTIIVDVEDNPNVSGEMSHTFPGGTGTIMDDLLNETNDIQIVIYNVYSEDLTLPCPGVVNQIEVTLYPELMATFPPVYVCEGECTDITPDIFGGIGAPYTYNWSTGENTPSINVCPLVPTTYFVTVEDGLGCMDIAEVQVDVRPPVELLLPESIDVCKDDNFDPFNPDYIVCLDFISGSSPYAVTWNAPPGLVGTPSGFFNECFIINELASSAVAGNNGQYVLSVSVTDFFGCMGETDMLVNITGELTLVLDVFEIECGDTEATINVTGFDAAGNSVTTFLLYGGCPDDNLGDFLEEINPSSGVGNFPPQDLLSYTCYTVVAQTESGCQTTQDITIPLTEGTPIEITGTPEVCIGEEATITITNASSFTSFVWMPDVGSSGSVTFTPDSTVTYFVEVVDVNGCNSQAVFTVTVNDPPVISMVGTTTFCEGGTASVTASGGAMYDWTSTISGFPMTGETITVGSPGDVTLTMTDVNGCSSDSTITFTQEDVITIQLGDVNICDGMGDTVFISNDFVNIEWYDSTPTLVSSTNFYVITGAGTFTVQANDANTGCDAMGSFEVMDFMTPNIMVVETVEVCREDSGVDSLCVNLNNLASGSAGVWSQVDIIPGFTVDLTDLSNVCFEGAPTGCYAFVYATNNAQVPCVDVNDTLLVCVKACPCPSPATGPIDPICNIGTTNLENAEITSDPGTWSVESGPAGQDLTGILTGTIFDASGIMGGDYVVRFTLDNPGGAACETFTEQTITVFEAPTISTSNGIMCNIDNGSDPIVLDLFTLIGVDVTDGGSWMQSSGTTVTISGGSTIMSSDLSAFPETLIFEYTSGVEIGSPCPPAVVTVEVLVRDCNCPFVDVLPDTLCNNGSLIDLGGLLVNPDGLGGTWSTSGTLVGADMFDPNGLPSGLYTITYTLNTSPGPNCDLEYTDNILIRRQSVAEPAVADPPCSIDTGNGPTTSNLYDWLQSGYSSGTWTQTGGTNIPFTDNGLDLAVVDFVDMPVGSSFIFTFTTIDAADPCSNISVDVTITVVDCNCPPIMIEPAADLCNDAGMIDLCALTVGSDPGTFTVATIGGTDVSDRITGCIFDASTLNPGDYVITYTLDQMVTGSCIQLVQDTFNVVQFLTATITDPPEVCSDPDGNGLMILNFTTYVSNSGSGTWEDTDNTGVAIATLGEQQSVSFVNVPAGNYTFTYTIDNEEPCEDVVLTMVVMVTDDCNCPSINPLTPADECNTDGPIDLTQYDDPIRPGTWSSDELTVENGNSLIIDGVVSGTYTLIYTIDEITIDCDSTETVMILIGEPGNPGTPAEAYRLCEGTSEIISLEGLLEGEDLGGSWTETSSSSSVGFSGADGMFTTDADVAGTYTFEYTLSNIDPCPDVSATVTVIIDPNPIADAGLEKFIDCINKTAVLGGANTSVGANITYSWLNTTTGEDEGTTETIEVSNPGTYELTVVNTETGCSARSTVEVMKSDDLPTMVLSPSDITCFGADDGGLILSDQTGGDGNYSYSLNGGAATTDANAFNTLPADDYTIEISDGIGCSQEYTFTILEPTALVVNAGPDIVGDLGETFTLSIDPFDTTGVTSIIWSDFETGDVICSGLGCTTITVTPILNVTNYYVEVINANGCTANDEIQIRLEQIVDVVFPNIITPNGDNTNDMFYVKSGDVESVISMKIFDRWGEKLFDLSNFPPRDASVGWDGKFNGKKVVPGVYVFIVEVLFVNGERETFNGDVTVTDSE